MSRFERIACVAARVAGVGTAAMAALYLRDAFRQSSAMSATIGLFLVALALGLVVLHPIALRVATGVLVLAAIVLPLGLLSPFRAGTLGGGNGVATTIAVALGASLVCVALAYLVGQARVAVVRRRGR